MCCVTLGQQFIPVVCDIKAALKEVVSCLSLEQGLKEAWGQSQDTSKGQTWKSRPFIKDEREILWESLKTKTLIIFSRSQKSHYSHLGTSGGRVDWGGET